MNDTEVPSAVEQMGAGSRPADSAGSTEHAEQNAQQINMQFKDENPGMIMKFNPITDRSYYDKYKVSTELSSFLSRPVLISEFTWEEGQDYAGSIDPWLLYFDNDIIRKKLDNYYLISCNLHLKIVINASPFYYGLLLAAYEPLTSFSGGILDLAHDPNQGRVPRSQRPHVWIYPQNCQGGEMCLPFFYHKDWLRATNGQDLADMGTLEFLSYVNLSNANSVAGSNVTVQVFAYAEDVRVCGPTFKQAVQSGDEYCEDGIISKPASAIAKAAGMLTDLPVIGNFMRATSFVSGKVGEVSAWFGFTNTPVIDDVKPFKDLPFHSFASTEIGQPIEKLTLDPKNELTIDPRVVGLDGVDELSMKGIIERESYLTQFAWSSARNAGETLWVANVQPDLHQASPFGTPTQYLVHSPPVAHLSRMFKYWTGDMIFRFRFICSRYHKGRVAIIFDPVEWNTSVNGLTFIPSNYNKIVDISKEPDVEIRVPYLQSTAWLETLFNVTRTDYTSAPGNLDPPNANNYNGALGVVVLTNQTSPVANADINVVVSVRGADNLRFAAPAEMPLNFSQFVPQSGEEMLDVPVKYNLSGERSTDDPNKDLVYMGESLVSLRQFLRRSSLVRPVAFDNTPEGQISQLTSVQGRYPLMYGYDPSGNNIAQPIAGGSNSRFNFNQLTAFNYVQNMFIGMRGSMNWHFNADGDSSARTLTVSRHKEQRNNANWSTTVTQPVGSVKNTVVRNVGMVHSINGLEGMSLLNQETQTGLSIQAPMYNKFRMLSTSPYALAEGTAENPGDDSLRVQITMHPKSGVSPENTVLFSYASIGTDFSFLYFLNVPTWFVYSELPPAV